MDFKKLYRFNFVGWRKYAFTFSGALLALSLISFLIQGMNLGIDFSGGTLVQVRFSKPVEIKKIRHALKDLQLGDTMIQEFGVPEEVLIRVEERLQDPQKQNQLGKLIQNTLAPLTTDQQVELRRIEYVGPQVGEELRNKGLLAVLYSLFAILAYVWWRFELHFAYGAVLALFHDVMLTMGLFSLFQKEFTLAVVAALLTVIGYSLNDTIVVYDRIREEKRRLRSQPIGEIVNLAVNRTLSRTLVTSVTTLLVLIALLLFGGEVIHDFSLALLFGVLIGTYSSIFVASPIVLLWEQSHRKGLSPTTPEKKTADASA
ncbi:protein translocase subunit SecF [Magnetococcales bacterium HHB-1]